MPQPVLNLLERKALLQQNRCNRMPLRYNNDKQKKPLFSKGFERLSSFIQFLFQVEN